MIPSIQFKYHLVYKKNMNIKNKNSVKAQMMQDTLFGPVFLIAAYPYPLRSLIVSIIPIEMS